MADLGDEIKLELDPEFLPSVMHVSSRLVDQDDHYLFSDLEYEHGPFSDCNFDLKFKDDYGNDTCSTSTIFLLPVTTYSEFLLPACHLSCPTFAVYSKFLLPASNCCSTTSYTARFLLLACPFLSNVYGQTYHKYLRSFAPCCWALLLVVTLMAMTISKELDGSDTRIANYFDVIAGTSAGGLITAMLAAPSASNAKQPCCEAKDIVPFYLRHSPLIFPYRNGLFGWFFRILDIIKMAIRPKYNGMYLHKLTNDLLGDTRMKDTLTNVVIPTFDVKCVKPTIFSTFKARSKPLKDARLADVCIGTSAAPALLPAHYFQILDHSGVPRTFNVIDGGIVANNPTLVAISEITKQIRRKSKEFPEIKPLDYHRYLVISLGTGLPEHDIMFDARRIAKWGIFGWIGRDYSMPLLHMFFHGSSDMTDNLVAGLFKAIGCSDQLLRIQDHDIPIKTVSNDLSTAEHLQELVKIGENLLSKKLSKEDLKTNHIVPMPEGGEAVTYADLLTRYAKLLSDERKLRLQNVKLDGCSTSEI